MSRPKEGFDPPAAHSMDTAWYAVDAEGNIGIFETGEDGALPSAAADTSGEYFDQSLLDCIRVGRRLAALSSADVEEAIEADRKTAPPRDVLIVLRVREEALVGGYRGERAAVPAEAHLGERPLVLSERPRIVASRSPCTADAVVAVRTSRVGLVVDGAQFGDWLYDEAELGGPTARDDGLFAYRQREVGPHTGPGAYVRTVAPSEPLRLENIEKIAGSADAAEVIGALSAVRFSESFATLHRVHLADSFAEADVVRWSEDVDLRGNYTGPPPELRARTERRRVWTLILGFAVLFVGVVFAVVHKKRLRAERQRAAEGRPSSEVPGGTVTGRRMRRP